MDLISRAAAIEVADAIWSVTGDKNVAKVWDQLKDLPSADAVEVVRCRDCEHYFTSSLERAAIHGAECTMMNRRTIPEDYCSYGQKM